MEPSMEKSSHESWKGHYKKLSLCEIILKVFKSTEMNNFIPFNCDFLPKEFLCTYEQVGLT